MSAEDGGPAFPGVDVSVTGIDSDGIERYETQACGGMSLRDYFAGKALQGLCANPAVFAVNNQCGWGLVNATEQQLSEYCLHLADAVITARNK